jgi:ACS family glucarate transporter-like MFS transporter
MDKIPLNETNNSQKKLVGNGRVGVRRYIMGIFLFLIFMVTYADRENLSIAFPGFSGPLHIDLVEYGLLSSAFFVTYTIFQIPGGIASERYGPRKIMTLAVAWWSAFTFLTGTAIDFLYMLIVRGLFGVGEAPSFPTESNITSRWFRKDESSKSGMFTMLGTFTGPILGTLLATYLLLTIGWRSIFYVFGIFGVVLIVVYYIVMRDSPDEVKWVHKDEINYINSSFDDPSTERGQNTKNFAPWKRLLKNGRFWALGTAHFASDGVLYVMLTLLPVYLEEVRHFSVSSLYLVGTVPWLIALVFIAISGLGMDYLIKRGASMFKSRVIPVVIASVLGTVFLLLAATATTGTMAVIWIGFGLAMIAPEQVSAWSIGANIGGIFSGTYGGWLNFLGNFSGITIPLIVTILASTINWTVAISFVAILPLIMGISYAVMRPDKSFAPGVIPDYKPPADMSAK